MLGYTIRKSDLDRITSKSSFCTSTREPFREKDFHLHNVSSERTKGWSNTVEATHQKQLNDAAERRAREETERCRTDLEERIWQLDERRHLIAQATEKLANESDMMKTFSSAMKFSAVLAEREHQLNAKKLSLDQERTLEEESFRQMKLNQNKLLEREISEEEASKTKKLAAAHMQREQLDMMRNRRLYEMRAERDEGVFIRQCNDQFLAEETNRKRREREKAVRAQKDTMAAQKYLVELKQREVDRTKCEEKHIAEYAVRMDETLARRKEAEASALNEKQAMREALIDAQAERLAFIRDNEDERITAQCLQTEEEQLAVENDKRMRLRAWRTEIEASRRAELERKGIDDLREGEDRKRVAEFTHLVSQKLAADELEESIHRREEAQKHACDLQKQIDAKKRKSQEAKCRQVSSSLRAAREANEANGSFDKFAEKIITEFAQAGKNIIPLMKALEREEV